MFNEIPSKNRSFSIIFIYFLNYKEEKNGFDLPLDDNLPLSLQPLAVVTTNQFYPVNSIPVHLCSSIKMIENKNLVKHNANMYSNNAIVKKRWAHLTWAVAVLLIVRFSANDANELSKSPVSTLPDALACDWFGCTCGWPPVFDKLKPWTFPDWVAVLPADAAVEAGIKTSPSASKPFIYIQY